MTPDLIFAHLYCDKYGIAYCMVENCNHCPHKNPSKSEKKTQKNKEETVNCEPYIELIEELDNRNI